MDELKGKIIGHLGYLKKNPTLLHLLIGKKDGMNEIVSKNEDLSSKARADGNKLFSKKEHNSIVHYRILQFYNRSIAFAPNESKELAMAYESKSAILWHIRKYPECIAEIDKALRITESDLLKVKLLCRKANCHTALGSSENRNCLEKAKFLFAKLSDSEYVRKSMNDLITRTQSIIDEAKLDDPKKVRKKKESLRITADAEKIDLWSSIKIEYNEKYGTHLVAARDFEPWEIVIVEKPYMNHLHESRRHSYCSHCWEYLWTVHPCEDCAWRLFCSEKCKLEAVSGYHGTECFVLKQMKETSLCERDDKIPFLISILIRALKEAGSINQLREDLEAVDKYKGASWGEFSTNEKIKDHQLLHICFRGCSITGDELENAIKISVIALLGLAKYSSIFDKTYDFNEVDKLMNDDSAMFIGALILRTFSLTKIKGSTMHHVDPNEECTIEDMSVRSKGIVARFKAFTLRSIGTLPIYGCFPNIYDFCAFGNRHVMYSLCPIKKGTPLITSTRSVYDYVFKSDKRTTYRNCCQRWGNCPACTEDWLENIFDRDRALADAQAKLSIWYRLDAEYSEIDEEIKRKRLRPSYPEPKLLAKAKAFATKVWEHFPMPSLMSYRAITTTRKLFGEFHCPGFWGLDKIESCKV